MIVRLALVALALSPGVAVAAAAPPPVPDAGSEREGGGGSSPLNFEPPALTRLRIAPPRFALGPGLPRLQAAGRAGERPRIRFRLSETARVRFRFRREQDGRFRKVRGSFAVDARPGANRVRFAGRLTSRRRLAPGRYRLIATPVDVLGIKGRSRRTTFTLLAPPW